MYAPPAFRANDLAALHATMRDARRANFVTATDEGLVATLLPLFLVPEEGRYGTLYGHLARANAQWTLPPKGDAMALMKTAHDFGTPCRIVETVAAVNDQRKRAMARKVIAVCGGNVRGSTIAVLGLTFKPNTDDMREAPSIALITALQDAGAKVRAYDPEGMKQARAVLENVEYAENAYSCIDGAEALVIVTEWDAFRALDLQRVRSLLKRPIVVDLRNIYRPADMSRHGFTYVSVGRAGSARDTDAGQ